MFDVNSNTTGTADEEEENDDSSTFHPNHHHVASIPITPTHTRGRTAVIALPRYGRFRATLRFRDDDCGGEAVVEDPLPLGREILVALWLLLLLLPLRGVPAAEDDDDAIAAWRCWSVVEAPMLLLLLLLLLLLVSALVWSTTPLDTVGTLCKEKDRGEKKNDTRLHNSSLPPSLFTSLASLLRRTVQKVVRGYCAFSVRRSSSSSSFFGPSPSDLLIVVLGQVVGIGCRLCFRQTGKQTDRCAIHMKDAFRRTM